MSRLIWTPNALRDVARLHGFLTARNPEAARRAVSAIRRGVRLLTDHPEAGRAYGESGLRELVIPFGAWGYIGLYRIAGEKVVLLAIRHGRELDYGEG